MRPDEGTLFVESLIAAAIVAMALGTTFQVIADSAARTRKAQAERTAFLIAQSQAALVGSLVPLRAAQTSGSDGAFGWRDDVAPYEAEGGPDSAGALWKVTVTVRRQGGGPVLARLETLRLGPVE